MTSECWSWLDSTSVVHGNKQHDSRCPAAQSCRRHLFLAEKGSSKRSRLAPILAAPRARGGGSGGESVASDNGKSGPGARRGREKSEMEEGEGGGKKEKEWTGEEGERGRGWKGERRESGTQQRRRDRGEGRKDRRSRRGRRKEHAATDGRKGGKKEAPPRPALGSLRAARSHPPGGGASRAAPPRSLCAGAARASRRRRRFPPGQRAPACSFFSLLPPPIPSHSLSTLSRSPCRWEPARRRVSPARSCWPCASPCTAPAAMGTCPPCARCSRARPAPTWRPRIPSMAGRPSTGPRTSARWGLAGLSRRRERGGGNGKEKGKEGAIPARAQRGAIFTPSARCAGRRRRPPPPFPHRLLPFLGIGRDGSGQPWRLAPFLSPRSARRG